MSNYLRNGLSLLLSFAQLRWHRDIFSSRIGRNFMILFKASSVSLIFPLICLPILTRVYPPNAFGKLAQYTSIISMVTAFSALRIDWLLPNARNEEEKKQMLAIGTISLSFTFLLSILISIILLTINAKGYSSQNSYFIFLFFLPFQVAFDGSLALVNGYIVSSGLLRSLAKYKYIKTMSNNLLSLLFGFFGFLSIGLIVSVLLSSLAVTITFSKNIVNSLTSHLGSFHWSPVFEGLRKYHTQIIASTCVSLLNSLSSVSQVLSISFFYGTDDTGLFAVSSKFIAIPIALVSSSIGTSFWARSAEIAKSSNPGRLLALYIKMSKYLCIAAVLTSIFIACFAVIMPYVLGQREWSKITNITIALLPLIFGGLVFSPLNHLVVHQKEFMQIWIDAAKGILAFLGVFVAHLLGGSIAVACLFSSLGILAGYSLLYPIQVTLMTRQLHQ